MTCTPPGGCLSRTCRLAPSPTCASSTDSRGERCSRRSKGASSACSCSPSPPAAAVPAGSRVTRRATASGSSSRASTRGGSCGSHGAASEQVGRHAGGVGGHMGGACPVGGCMAAGGQTCARPPPAPASQPAAPAPARRPAHPAQAPGAPAGGQGSRTRAAGGGECQLRHRRRLPRSNAAPHPGARSSGSSCRYGARLLDACQGAHSCAAALPDTRLLFEQRQQGVEAARGPHLLPAARPAVRCGGAGRASAGVFGKQQ